MWLSKAEQLELRIKELEREVSNLTICDLMKDLPSEFIVRCKKHKELHPITGICPACYVENAVSDTPQPQKHSSYKTSFPGECEWFPDGKTWGKLRCMTHKEYFALGESCSKCDEDREKEIRLVVLEQIADSSSMVMELDVATRCVPPVRAGALFIRLKDQKAKLWNLLAEWKQMKSKKDGEC